MGGYHYIAFVGLGEGLSLFFLVFITRSHYCLDNYNVKLLSEILGKNSAIGTEVHIFGQEK